MRVLAEAKPNPLYVNYRCLADLTIQAQFMNNQILYVETHSKNPDWRAKVKESTLKDMFSVSRQIKDRPFLIKENREFFIVLNRRKKRYHDSFLKIKRNKK